LTDDEDGEGAPAQEGDEAVAKKEDGERQTALTAVTEDGPIPKEAVDATKANNDKEQ
jgi:hypothetical protein